MNGRAKGIDPAKFWEWATTPGNLPDAERQKLLDMNKPPAEWPQAWDFAGGIEAVKAQIDQAGPSPEELAWMLATLIVDAGSLDTARRGAKFIAGAGPRQRGNRTRQRVSEAWRTGGHPSKQACAAWCEQELGIPFDTARGYLKGA